jgi:hypothetical protein
MPFTQERIPGRGPHPAQAAAAGLARRKCDSRSFSSLSIPDQGERRIKAPDVSPSNPSLIGVSPVSAFHDWADNVSYGDGPTLRALRNRSHEGYLSRACRQRIRMSSDAYAKGVPHDCDWSYATICSEKEYGPVLQNLSPRSDRWSARQVAMA